MRQSANCPVFVVGVARSGTTLLMSMLDAHPAFAIPSESHFIPVLYRISDTFGDLNQPLNRERLVRRIVALLRGYWHAGSEEDWIPGALENAHAIAETAEPSYEGVVRAIYEFHARRRGRRRWGDKTPGYIDSLPELHSMFPDARFIHIVRDGRDVACSVMPLSFGPNTVYMAARRWKHCLGHAIEFANAHPEIVHTVRYEDLVEHPEEQLRTICAFLGEEYDPVMLEFHKSRNPGATPEHHKLTATQVNSSRKARWKRQMSQRQVRIFEATAGEMLRHFGYEQTIPGAKFSRWDRVFGRLGNKMLFFRPFSKPRGLVSRVKYLFLHRKWKRQMGSHPQLSQ